MGEDQTLFRRFSTTRRLTPRTLALFCTMVLLAGSALATSRNASAQSAAVTGATCHILATTGGPWTSQYNQSLSVEVVGAPVDGVRIGVALPAGHHIKSGWNPALAELPDAFVEYVVPGTYIPGLTPLGSGFNVEFTPTADRNARPTYTCNPANAPIPTTTTAPTTTAPTTTAAPPTTTTTTPPTTTTATTPPTTSPCTIDAVTLGPWTSQYNQSLFITNTGTTITGVRVTITFPPGHRYYSGWNPTLPTSNNTTLTYDIPGTYGPGRTSLSSGFNVEFTPTANPNARPTYTCNPTNAPPPTTTPTTTPPTTTTTAPPGTTGLPAGTPLCSVEGGFCAFAGTQTVYYGANGVYVAKSLTEGTTCNNSVFNHPNASIGKQCYVKTPGLPGTYQLCSSEGGTCGVNGTQLVLYGGGTSFAARSVMDGAVCSNALFGDPAPNVAKNCYSTNPLPNTYASFGYVDPQLPSAQSVPFSPLNANSLEFVLNHTLDPTPGPGQVTPGYFWSTQFDFAGGGGVGGYFGMQKDQLGKRFLFSIWGATGARCAGIAGATCGPFTEGSSGNRVVLEFPWVARTNYRLKLTKGTVDPDGSVWWDFNVYADNNTLITRGGSVQVPASFGGLTGYAVQWTESYGHNALTCSQLTRADSWFSRPLFDGQAPGAYTPSVGYPTVTPCPAEAVLFNGGVTQRMGV